MRFIKKLPTVADVSAGADISIVLPVGNVYETVYVYYSGVTPEQLQQLKLKANTRTISEWANGADLISIDNHYKRETLSGVLVFHFKRTELDELSQRRFFGFDTSGLQGIKTASIDMHIDSAASSPKISAIAVTSLPTRLPNGKAVPNWLTKMRTHYVSVSQGDFEIDNIPTPDGASIAAIHLVMPDTDDADADCQVLEADLQINQTSWHPITAAQAFDIQAAHGRAPQRAKMVTIDLILDNDINQAAALNRAIEDLRVKGRVASAGQIKVMVEYVQMWSPVGF